MKVLSLKQPWAFLIVNGLKDVENRRWSTKHRGLFLVHASKGMTKEYYDWAVGFARLVDPAAARAIPDLRSEALLRGGIVGQAKVTGVLPPCLLGCDVDEDVWCRCGHGWHLGHEHGFLLEDAMPLPFRPLKGQLNFFEEKVSP